MGEAKKTLPSPENCPAAGAKETHLLFLSPYNGCWYEGDCIATPVQIIWAGIMLTLTNSAWGPE